MNQNYAKLTFSESVKKVQEQFGSRKHYSRVEESADRFILTDSEIQYIKSRDSFYISSVGENDWPYIQHRGGQKGFLKVINETTLGMADFSGNKQYISTGNLKSNNKSMLFIMDYPTQSRLKVWVETEIVEKNENPELYKQLVDNEYAANVERLLLFHIKAYDWNCNQHITQRFTNEEFEMLIMNQSL